VEAAAIINKITAGHSFSLWEDQMKIVRIISIGIAVMFALAVGIASFDPTYAVGPCCALKDGVWIVTKTGKPASPAQIQTMQKSQSPASIKAAAPPKPAGGAPTGTRGGGGGGHK
jgi:hypothetical protein